MQGLVWFVVLACLACPLLVCADLTAPTRFVVEFNTTVSVNNGTFHVEVQRAWAPHGADHFYTLLQPGTYYYDNNGFFRVISGFVAQVSFGRRRCITTCIDQNGTVGNQWRS